MPEERPTSETSPLISKPTAEDERTTATTTTTTTTNGLPNANGHHVSDGDGAAIERQTSLEGRLRQYEGIPDVRRRMKVMFPALAIGVFLSAADQTIIVSSYGKIGDDLQALQKTSWIATAYFLTLTSFQPLYGRMSDIFGRKPCLLFAYAVFGLGTLFCGLARNIDELILARAFAGVGGGGMTTVVSILLSDAIPLKDRGTWQGYINIVYASGAGCGAPLGGLLADSVGWRWAFLVQVPLCLAALVSVAALLKVPQSPEQQESWRVRLKRIDFLGAAILVSAVFCLIFGLDRGSNASWTEPIALVPLCLSLPLFVLFAFVEVKVAKDPFAPGRIIFERSLFAAYLCNFFSFAGWLAALFYIPLYFQAVDGVSATKAGVLLIPAIAASVSGSLFAGFYMQRTGKYYWLTVIAYANLVLGLFIIVCLSGLVATSRVGICIGMAICGFSNGIGVTTCLIALISNASREDQAVATACSYLFRSLGSTTGVSLASTAANQTLRSSLATELGNGKAADQIVQRVRESLEYIKTLEPSTRALVRHCYALSTRAAFVVELGLVFGALASAWLIRERPLSG